MTTLLSRRRMLQALGVGAAALPLLDDDHARAHAAGFPRRLIVLIPPNGILADAFWPGDKRDENDFTMGEVLRPLDDASRKHGSLKKDIILVGGLTMQSALDDDREQKLEFGVGNSHNCLPHMLTGAFAVRSTDKGHPCGNAISLDQYVAAAIAKTSPTKFSSLELALQQGSGVSGYNMYPSYRGPALGTGATREPQWNVTEQDPARLFARVFADRALSPQQFDQLRADEKSILDLVARDLDRLAKNLGTDDRARVQLHLDSIRQIEKQISGAPATCSAPTVPALDKNDPLVKSRA